MGEVTGIYTKYELPYSSDNLLETGPQSQSRIQTLNVSIGFGAGGSNGRIEYSMDLSEFYPTINRTADYTNDIVEWEMVNRTLFPLNINNATLDCLASWASVGHLAAIDVYYKGRVNVGLRINILLPEAIR